MASGVRVDDSVVNLFQDMKCTNPRKTNKKVVFFGFSKNEDSIVVDPGREILIDDASNFFPRLKALLPLNKCCYVLMDINYFNGETDKDELIFIMWAPEDAPVKQKLLFASSKTYLSKILQGVYKSWEIHSLDDFTVEALADKLAGRKCKSVEGYRV
ncbi:destrin [Dendropsophus ebraccatus]|uniref:destrin n=1 Tax=Dendropsophus ebraccatus TaxID=150705 RepID=UPI00383158E4